MIFNYQKPFIKTLSEKSISFHAFAASVVLIFNPNDCDGPLGAQDTIEVENDQATACIVNAISLSSGQEIQVQCAETGSEVFVVTVESVNCAFGTCDSAVDGLGDNDDDLCDLSFSISPEPPAVCTATTFFLVGPDIDGCDPLTSAPTTDAVPAS